MALRDIVDKGRVKAEALARRAGIIPDRPEHTGDGFHLDGKDGRSRHLAIVMPMIVARLEKADDQMVASTLGNPAAPVEIPAHGRDRRNAIRQMTVDAFRTAPYDESQIEPGHTLQDMADIRHSAEVEDAMLRRMTDPHRIDGLIEAGGNLAIANWDYRREMSNRVIDILQPMPSDMDDTRIARESRHLGRADANELLERFSHAPVARMDVPSERYGERQVWIAEQLEGERAAIMTGRVGAMSLLDIAMMERGPVPDHGHRAIALTPPHIHSSEVDGAWYRQTMANAAPAMRDEDIHAMVADVPGTANRVIPKDPEERSYWTAVALEASYLRQVAGLPPAATPASAALPSPSAERQMVEERLEREETPPGHHARAAAASRAQPRMDVTM